MKACVKPGLTNDSFAEELAACSLVTVPGFSQGGVASQNTTTQCDDALSSALDPILTTCNLPPDLITEDIDLVAIGENSLMGLLKEDASQPRTQILSTAESKQVLHYLNGEGSEGGPQLLNAEGSQRGSQFANTTGKSKCGPQYQITEGGPGFLNSEGSQHGQNYLNSESSQLFFMESAQVGQEFLNTYKSQSETQFLKGLQQNREFSDAKNSHNPLCMNAESSQVDQQFLSAEDLQFDPRYLNTDDSQAGEQFFNIDNSQFLTTDASQVAQQFFNTDGSQFLNSEISQIEQACLDTESLQRGSDYLEAPSHCDPRYLIKEESNCGQQYLNPETAQCDTQFLNTEGVQGGKQFSNTGVSQSDPQFVLMDDSQNVSRFQIAQVAQPGQQVSTSESLERATMFSNTENCQHGSQLLKSKGLQLFKTQILQRGRQTDRDTKQSNTIFVKNKKSEPDVQLMNVEDLQNATLLLKAKNSQHDRQQLNTEGPQRSTLLLNASTSQPALQRLNTGLQRRTLLLKKKTTLPTPQVLNTEGSHPSTLIFNTKTPRQGPPIINAKSTQRGALFLNLSQRGLNLANTNGAQRLQFINVSGSQRAQLLLNSQLLQRMSQLQDAEQTQRGSQLLDTPSSQRIQLLLNANKLQEVTGPCNVQGSQSAPQFLNVLRSQCKAQPINLEGLSGTSKSVIANDSLCESLTAANDGLQYRSQPQIKENDPNQGSVTKVLNSDSIQLDQKTHLQSGLRSLNVENFQSSPRPLIVENSQNDRRSLDIENLLRSPRPQHVDVSQPDPCVFQDDNLECDQQSLKEDGPQHSLRLLTTKLPLPRPQVRRKKCLKRCSRGLSAGGSQRNSRSLQIKSSIRKCSKLVEQESLQSSTQVQKTESQCTVRPMIKKSLLSGSLKGCRKHRGSRFMIEKREPQPQREAESVNQKQCTKFSQVLSQSLVKVRKPLDREFLDSLQKERLQRLQILNIEIIKPSSETKIAQLSPPLLHESLTMKKQCSEVKSQNLYISTPQSKSQSINADDTQLYVQDASQRESLLLKTENTQSGPSELNALELPCDQNSVILHTNIVQSDGQSLNELDSNSDTQFLDVEKSEQDMPLLDDDYSEFHKQILDAEDSEQETQLLSKFDSEHDIRLFDTEDSEQEAQCLIKKAIEQQIKPFDVSDSEQDVRSIAKKDIQHKIQLLDVKDSKKETHSITMNDSNRNIEQINTEESQQDASTKTEKDVEHNIKLLEIPCESLDTKHSKQATDLISKEHTIEVLHTVISKQETKSVTESTKYRFDRLDTKKSEKDPLFFTRTDIENKIQLLDLNNTGQSSKVITEYESKHNPESLNVVELDRDAPFLSKKNMEHKNTLLLDEKLDTETGTQSMFVQDSEHKIDAVYSKQYEQIFTNEDIEKIELPGTEALDSQKEYDGAKVVTEIDKDHNMELFDEMNPEKITHLMFKENEKNTYKIFDSNKSEQDAQIFTDAKYLEQGQHDTQDLLIKETSNYENYSCNTESLRQNIHALNNGKIENKNQKICMKDSKHSTQIVSKTDSQHKIELFCIDDSKQSPKLMAKQDTKLEGQDVDINISNQVVHDSSQEFQLTKNDDNWEFGMQSSDFLPVTSNYSKHDIHDNYIANFETLDIKELEQQVQIMSYEYSLLKNEELNIENNQKAHQVLTQISLEQETQPLSNEASDYNILDLDDKGTASTQGIQQNEYVKHENMYQKHDIKELDSEESEQKMQLKTKIDLQQEIQDLETVDSGMCSKSSVEDLDTENNEHKSEIITNKCSKHTIRDLDLEDSIQETQVTINKYCKSKVEDIEMEDSDLEIQLISNKFTKYKYQDLDMDDSDEEIHQLSNKCKKHEIMDLVSEQTLTLKCVAVDTEPLRAEVSVIKSVASISATPFTDGACVPSERGDSPIPSTSKSTPGSSDVYDFKTAHSKRPMVIYSDDEGNSSQPAPSKNASVSPYMSKDCWLIESDEESDFDQPSMYDPVYKKAIHDTSDVGRDVNTLSSKRSWLLDSDDEDFNPEHRKIMKTVAHKNETPDIINDVKYSKTKLSNPATTKNSDEESELSQPSTAKNGSSKKATHADTYVYIDPNLILSKESPLNNLKCRFMKNLRGGKMLVVGNIKYRINSFSPDKVRWRCSTHERFGCKGRIHTIENKIVYFVNEHITCHPDAVIEKLVTTDTVSNDPE